MPNPVPSTRSRERVTRLRAAQLDDVRRSGLLAHAPPANDRPVVARGPHTERIPAALREQVCARVVAAVGFARRHWSTPFRMPNLAFDLAGRSAGVAQPATWSIRINAVLLLENPQRVVADTVIHELAHLLTAALHGSGAAPHGAQWRAVMCALGAKPSRTHDMDVTNAVAGALVFKYRCACRQMPRTPRQHSASQHKRYVCTKCSHVIAFTGEVRRNGVWRMEGPPGKSQPASQASPGVCAASVR